MGPVADSELMFRKIADLPRALVASPGFILSELIPRFKHRGFAGELEWRLVVQHRTLRDSVCFWPNRNVLVPYIKLGNGEPLPLKRIRVGPGHDTKLTQRSVEQYLEANGYNVEVKTSDVPFRS